MSKVVFLIKGFIRKVNYRRKIILLFNPQFQVPDEIAGICFLMCIYRGYNQS